MIILGILILFESILNSATQSIEPNSEKQIEILKDRIELLSKLREIYIDEGTSERVFDDDFWNNLIEKKSIHQHNSIIDKNVQSQRLMKSLNLLRTIRVIA